MPQTASTTEAPVITITVPVRKGWNAERNEPDFEDKVYEVEYRDEARTVRTLNLKDAQGTYPIPVDEHYRSRVREAFRSEFGKPVSWL